MGSPPTKPEADEAGDADAEKLARLQSEVLSLRAELRSRGRRASTVTTIRRLGAAVAIMVAAFALVASVVGLWAANTTLNTDRWVATVAPLPKNPQVAAAVTEYTTTEVFDLINVDQRLRAALPERAGFLVEPAVEQVRQYVQRTVYTFVQSDGFQKIWVPANRRAHQQALALLEGRSDLAVAHEDHITIDLMPLINQVLRQISSSLPALFGHTITLPDLSSGAIPANLRARVENAVGVRLPANFAQFTVYDAGKLKALQEGLLASKRAVALLGISTILLLGLALIVSPWRRRTLLQLGVWLAVAAIAITASLRAVRSQLLAQVPTGTYRNGASAAVDTVVASLRQRGVQIIWVAALLTLIAYLVGPGRAPVWLRRTVAAGARAAGRGLRRGGTFAIAHGPAWISRHRDPIRIAGVVVAGAVALVLSSWTALLVAVLALAAYEIGVTIIARTVPVRPNSEPVL
jgi:hypothetical protein